ncbi:MAG: ZTL protein [Candidatus Dormibacteria bacterium]
MLLERLPDRARRNSIDVLAGVNGAGKSSVLAATYLWKGIRVFNPDDATQLILAANPHLALNEANGLAWQQGKSLLGEAILNAKAFAFETTLGGNSITAMLESALDLGQDVRMLYVGLDGPELHVARVRSLVDRGGHDVPEDMIRRRYDASRLHLIRLLGKLTELRVYDNSQEADPEEGNAPVPALILRTDRGKVVQVIALETVPEWAKPIVAAALGLPE